MALFNYRLNFAKSARNDQKEIKRYIIREFGYREYGKNFDAKMKSAANVIKNAASHIRPTSLYYRGYNIYMMVHKTYLFFYVVNEEKHIITVLRVLNEGREWMKIIKDWIKDNG